MKHRCSFILCFVSFLFSCVLVSAQNDLQLSGVMQGERPTAIINDKIVAAGDSIGNYKVLEVGPDYVIVQGASGKMTLHLKDSATKIVSSPPVKPQVVYPNISTSLTSAQESPSKIEVSMSAHKHMSQSVEYLQQGDALLKTALKFRQLYAKAVELCALAESEAQLALKEISDGADRTPMNEHIARIRKAKAAIMREETDFNTRVRLAIAGRQVFAGMTTQDVTSSWGVPLSKTNVRDNEKWAYQDPNGYQKDLTFTNGILVSF